MILKFLKSTRILLDSSSISLDNFPAIKCFEFRFVESIAENACVGFQMHSSTLSEDKSLSVGILIRDKWDFLKTRWEC